MRRAQSGTLTVYEYCTIVAPITTSLPSIPAMTLHFPASTSLAGKAFYYGISDLNAQGGLVSFNTQGPGKVDGQTVSFAQVPTALTFEAGHKYTFVVYATATAVAAQFLYVANNAANSITAYALPAQGNVAPTRTISGPATGLSGPLAIAVDAKGNIAVLNSNGFVVVFPDGGNGNVPPLKKFSLSSANLSALLSFASDPFSGDIYVGGYTPYFAGTVSVFSPSGAFLRSIVLQDATGPDPLHAYPTALAVDNKDELIVGEQIAMHEVCTPYIAVYAPNASGNVSSLGKKQLVGDCNTVVAAYARTTDHIFTILSILPLYSLYENQNGSFATVRTMDNLLNLNVGDYTYNGAMAVDPSGQNVYAVGDSGNSVYHFADDPASATGFVQIPRISGPKTGLSQARGLAIGNP
jgi:hypothetical protein